MITVHKFGGGVLRQAEDFSRAASLVSDPTEQVVVVSALYGVTDALDAIAKKSLTSDEYIDDFTNQLVQQHLRLLELLNNSSVQKNVSKNILNLASWLNKLLYGVFLLKELTPRTVDIVHSFGERLSAIILETYLQGLGRNAKALNADEAGLITDSNFTRALPLMDKTTENLRRHVLPLTQNGIVVFTGYFGASEQGDVTTLGRGGSDFSAGIVASALEAEKLVVWKDVEGFMSADPKIVSGAQLISVLSYDEAEELGYFGAKILHPKTIAPLREKRIPVHIKNVFAPQKAGTVISSNGKKSKTIAKSVAVKEKACVVSVKGGSLSGVSSTAYALFSQLQHLDLPIDAISTSQSDLSICFEEKYLPQFQQALRQAHVQDSEISVEQDSAVLGLIGEGMRQSIGVSGRLFSCLGHAGVNVRMISQGASEINISFAIARDDVGRALNAVHHEFIDMPTWRH